VAISRRRHAVSAAAAVDGPRTGASSFQEVCSDCSQSLLPFFSCYILSNCFVEMHCLSPHCLSCGTRRTLAVVSGALIAGGALAYARSNQSRRRRRSEANHGSEASELATNGDGLSQNGRLAATKQKKSGLKSLHFLTAILLKKIGPSGTRFLLGLVLTAVSSTIFYDECILLLELLACHNSQVFPMS
jgi:hypothetical protein